MLISGFTVMAAMAGMFFAGNPVSVSFGIGTIIVVGVAMVGSVTVLPALLSYFGRKGWLEKGRVPYVARRRHRTHGIKSTAGVITSAAAVMVVTFAMFATGSDQSMKQLGVGLAAAILIDATIVRAVLLPATMKLLGDRNWYLPKRLGWLPKFEHEPQVTPAAA